MTGSVLLDSNIVIALFANQSSVIENLRSSTEVFVPSIVIGELTFGARKSNNVDTNLERIEAFQNASSILSVDAQTAHKYGEIKNSLREKGKPIPENDIWIAAIAKQHDLTVVTNDSHFQQVENLPVVAW